MSASTTIHSSVWTIHIAFSRALTMTNYLEMQLATQSDRWYIGFTIVSNNSLSGDSGCLMVPG